MREPIIALASEIALETTGRMAATGQSFSIYEWRGSGPTVLHVHYQDDEAWHVLEGTLKFRFADREVEVGPGSTIFVPAGVPHSYAGDNARYLIILTPRLEALIRELHQAPDPKDLPEIFRKYESELLD